MIAWCATLTEKEAMSNAPLTGHRLAIGEVFDVQGGKLAVRRFITANVDDSETVTTGRAFEVDITAAFYRQGERVQKTLELQLDGSFGDDLLSAVNRVESISTQVHTQLRGCEMSAPVNDWLRVGFGRAAESLPRGLVIEIDHPDVGRARLWATFEQSHQLRYLLSAPS